jgi:hypothetical protein
VRAALDPRLLKCNWSQEEEQKLLDSVNLHGEKAWTRIAAELGNRNDVQCRFRYRFLCQKARQIDGAVRPISAPRALIPIPERDVPIIHRAAVLGGEGANAKKMP